MAHEPTLGKIHTDTQLIIQEIGHVKDTQIRQQNIIDSHEDQLKSLGKWKSYLGGAWATVALGLAWVVSNIYKTGGGA